MIDLFKSPKQYEDVICTRRDVRDLYDYDLYYSNGILERYSDDKLRIRTHMNGRNRIGSRFIHFSSTFQYDGFYMENMVEGEIVKNFEN